DVAPHLTVGEYVNPRRLLDPQGLVDGAILDLLVLLRAELPGTEVAAGLDKPRRTKHRTDHVGTVDRGCFGHRILSSRPWSWVIGYIVVSRRPKRRVRATVGLGCRGPDAEPRAGEAWQATK